MIVDSSLIKNINKYIEDLQRDKHFDFSPVNVGITKHGNNLKLGFSCYALKLLFITKKWDQLNSQKQNELEIFNVLLEKQFQKNHNIW